MGIAALSETRTAGTGVLSATVWGAGGEQATMHKTAT
jgi:hypothetical protein